MKALLIKYHGPTNTKGSRLSVQSEGYKPLYEPLNVEQDFEDQAYDMATRYFEGRFRIDTSKHPFAIGTLPNGDIAAVLI